MNIYFLEFLTLMRELSSTTTGSEGFGKEKMKC